MFNDYFFIIQWLYISMNFGANSIWYKESRVRSCCDMLNIDNRLMFGSEFLEQ